jgi:YHS domain-containing protein
MSREMSKVYTKICPTCNCSLVRLGIAKSHIEKVSYKEKEVYFCCKGCKEVFSNDPEKYLKEVKEFVVCPTCLAEKLIKYTVKHTFNSLDFYFCRCPHCLTEFHKKPEYFIKRLEGELEFKGIFSDSCCN